MKYWRTSKDYFSRFPPPLEILVQIVGGKSYFKVMGGGLNFFSCFNISSPGFVEPGTFYRIEKFCPSVKI